MKAYLTLLFLLTVSSVPVAGQKQSHLAETKSYVRYMDSVWLRLQPDENDELEFSDLFNVGGSLTVISGDTLKQMSLQNMKGDTIYFVNYYDTRERDTEETYYLKNKQVVAAKLDFKEGGTRYQRVVFYENSGFIIEDSTKGIDSTNFGNNIYVTFPVRHFKYLKDFHNDKKEKLLSITARYFPGNYTIIENCSSNDVGFFAKSDSFENYFFDFTDVIHEGYHIYSRRLVSEDFFKYRLNDKLTIGTKRFESFPAITISDMVPMKFQTGRLHPYIFGKNGGTQGNGFLGILEEYVAYFQGLKTYTGSFYFLRDSFQFSTPAIWFDYLNKVSYVPAVNEFKLFISWYLQYAKQHDDALFQRIVQDKGIKQLFTHVEDESQRLIDEYLLHRLFIIKTIKPFIEKAVGEQRAKYEKILAGSNNILLELFYIDNLLKQKEHQILDLLRH
jgi:hypothetical protein